MTAGEVESVDTSGTAISEADRAGLDARDAVALLEAAADRLEELADTPNHVPWVLHPRGAASQVVDAALDFVADADEANAAWIAALHPGVAEPLASWLRSQAAWLECDVVPEAVEFARLILPGFEAARFDPPETDVSDRRGEPPPGAQPETPLRRSGAAPSTAQGASRVPLDGSGRSDAPNRATRTATLDGTTPQPPSTPPPGAPGGLGVPTAGSGSPEGSGGPEGPQGLERDLGGGVDD